MTKAENITTPDKTKKTRASSRVRRMLFGQNEQERIAGLSTVEQIHENLAIAVAPHHEGLVPSAEIHSPFVPMEGLRDQIPALKTEIPEHVINSGEQIGVYSDGTANHGITIWGSDGTSLYLKELYKLDLSPESIENLDPQQLEEVGVLVAAVADQVKD